MTDGSGMHPETGNKGSGRAIRVALFLSLAFNLLVVGLVSAA